MSSKNISVREDVYRALQNAKGDDESFSDVIERLLEARDGDHPLYGLVGTLDEEEVEAVEEEFGTEFSTGNEVESAGEADIEPPEPEDAQADEAPAGDEEPDVGEVAAAGGDGGASEPTPDAPETGEEETDAEADAAEAAAEAGDVDLVDAAVAAMEALDDGDGAEHGAVVDAVASEHGVDEAAVEDAIDEALMGGRCYEPDDDHLKAI